MRRGGGIEVKDGVRLEDEGIYTTSNLMSPDSKNWNAKLLWHKFAAYSATRILVAQNCKVKWRMNMHGDGMKRQK